MLNKIYLSEWDRIRSSFLKTQKPKSYYVEGEKCRKCVWSVTDSGKILCSKSCVKKGNKV